MARYGMQRDQNMADAIRVLRAGQSRGQQNQAFMDKALIGGTMAGIGAIGHAMSAAESEKKQELNRKRDIMADSIAGQTKLSGQQDAIRKSSEQYAAPDYQRAPGAEAYDRPEPEWLKSQADAAIANQAANGAASMAEIGGYHTPAGLKAQDESAGAQSRDMQTSKDIIGTGGMLNSLPKVSR